MTKPGVYFIVDFAITAGKFEEFQSIAAEMVAGTQSEPGALAYEFDPTGDGTESRLIEVYADSDAALLHTKGRVVQELVPKLLTVSSLTAFSVYGDLTAECAEMLTRGGATLFQTRQGFNRF
jgi:quinol monooxygenase YgiN